MNSMKVLSYRFAVDDDLQKSTIRTTLTIIKELKKHSNISEQCIYLNGGSTNIETSNGILNVFAFQNALNVIEYFKPDLILIENDHEYIQRGLILAAKFKNIPSVVILSTRDVSFHQSSNVKQNIKSSMRMLKDVKRKIIPKYIFLLRTMLKCNYGVGFLIKSIFYDFYYQFKYLLPMATFPFTDMYIVRNESWANIIKTRTSSIPISICGDCGMDITYDKISQISKQTAENNNVIMLATTAVVEHGYCTRNQRNVIIKKILTGLKTSFSEKEIIVKIHPGENLEEYKKMIHSTYPNVKIFQRENFLDLAKNCDSIIFFEYSTAMLESILLEKYVFVLTIFDINRPNNPILKENLATECFSIEELIKKLKENTWKPNEKLVDEYIKKTLYKFDGKCSERAVQKIMSLVNSYNKE